MDKTNLGCKTKELWKNPAYREMMSEKHKGKIHSGSFKKGHKIRNTGRTWFKKEEMMGDKNPAKRLEIRKKISENNAYYWLGRNKEMAPNWQNGKSFELYPIDWTDDLKESIRKRDDYICYLCGIHQDELNERLHCHHIGYDKDNLDPKNLISLCRNCHMKTNYNREYWIDFF